MFVVTKPGFFFMKLWDIYSCVFGDKIVFLSIQVARDSNNNTVVEGDNDMVS